MNLSCNPAGERSNEIVFSRFPEEISLHSAPLPVDYIMKTGRLEVVDSFLLVVDTWTVDYFIKIFNIHSGELLISLCPRGKGPSETEFVSSFSFYPPGRKIFINDFRKNHFLIWQIDSALQDSGYQPLRLEVPGKYYPLWDHVVLSDSCIGVSGLFRELICRVNVRGEEVGCFGENVMASLLGYPTDLSRALFSIDLQEGILAGAYLFFDRLLICNALTGETICMVTGPDRITMEEQQKRNEQSRWIGYYGKPVIWQGRIWAAYQGAGISTTVNNQPSLNYPSCILVFSLDGTPEAKIVLDRRIQLFAIDRNRQKLVAYSPDEEHGFIYYDLSAYVKK